MKRSLYLIMDSNLFAMGSNYILKSLKFDTTFYSSDFHLFRREKCNDRHYVISDCICYVKIDFCYVRKFLFLLHFVPCKYCLLWCSYLDTSQSFPWAEEHMARQFDLQELQPEQLLFAGRDIHPKHSRFLLMSIENRPFLVDID